MSKTSAKAQYQQLKEWLDARGTKSASKKQVKQFSKLDYYNQKQ